MLIWKSAESVNNTDVFVYGSNLPRQNECEKCLSFYVMLIFVCLPARDTMKFSHQNSGHKRRSSNDFCEIREILQSSHFRKCFVIQITIQYFSYFPQPMLITFETATALRFFTKYYMSFISPNSVVISVCQNQLCPHTYQQHQILNYIYIWQLLLRLLMYKRKSLSVVGVVRACRAASPPREFRTFAAKVRRISGSYVNWALEINTTAHVYAHCVSVIAAVK